MIESLRKVKRGVAPILRTKPNVVGVGVGFKEKNGKLTSEPCIVVYVSRKRRGLSAKDIIPKTVCGLPTDVKEATFGSLALRTEKWRPAPGGVSIGHKDITAGTLGCIVLDKYTKAFLILSNNHVLANENDGLLGDAILQPGPSDGGTDTVDRIGELVRFVELTSSGNEVDCAVCSVAVDDYADLEVLEIAYPPRNTRALALGDTLRKSGRTTSITEGEVTCVDLDVYVDYPTLGTIAFIEQIEMSGIAIVAGGDSGSLVWSGEHPVGLLFAGTGDQKRALLNPIDKVLDMLEIVFASPEVAGSFEATVVASGMGVAAEVPPHYAMRHCPNLAFIGR